MYKILYMKADYEPWWQFEGWEDQIVSSETFNTKEQFDNALLKKLEIFRGKYPNERCEKDVFWAFWTEEESVYCEGCDEEVQLYHGLVLVLD